MATFLKRGRAGRPLLVAGCAWTIGASASAASVWVVTDRQHSVTHAQAARVIELDAPALFEAELSSHLPADPKRAATIVRQRLKAGGNSLQHHLAAAYQGVTDAWNLGITEIPAVLVDRRYVVYGVPDVDRAVSLIEKYREKQQR